MSEIRLLVGTPIGGGVVSQDYMHGLMQLRDYADKAGWSMEYVSKADGLVTRPRNTFASMVARDERYTHLLMLDADVVVPPAGIQRLLDSGHDVCGCIVPFRKVNWERVGRLARAVPDADPTALEAISAEYAVRLLPGEGGQDGFIRVQAIGSAVMLISRKALLDVIDSGLVQEATLGMLSPDGHTGGWTFFDTYVDDGGVYLSEDYAFCDRWRRLGGSVWADTQTPTRHVGPVVIHGDFAASLTSSSAMIRGEAERGT